MKTEKQFVRRFDLRDISLREKLLIALALLSLVTFMAARWIIIPAYDDYLSKKTTIDHLNKTKADLIALEKSNSAIAQKLDNAITKGDELKLTLKMVERGLKNSERLNGVLSLLDNLKSGGRMEVVTLSMFSEKVIRDLNHDDKPETQTNNEEKVEFTKAGPSKLPDTFVEYDRNVIQINVKSEYTHLAFFVSRLFESDFAPSVKRIAVGAGSKTRPEMLTAQIELEVITL